MIIFVVESEAVRLGPNLEVLGWVMFVWPVIHLFAVAQEPQCSGEFQTRRVF